jgi:hypothetical protein
MGQPDVARHAQCHLSFSREFSLSQTSSSNSSNSIEIHLNLEIEQIFSVKQFECNLHDKNVK